MIRYIFVVLALTFVWCIFMESFDPQTIGIGIFMGLASIQFAGKHLNFEKIENVNFFKLVFYPPWLIMRVYMDAIFLARLVFTKCKWGVVEERVKLESGALRTILANSITLTPGSVCLERKGKSLSLLCIDRANADGFPAAMADLRNIERMLLKADMREE